MNDISSKSNDRPRFVALDQYRGFTVAAMFLVNFLSDFGVTPEVLKHHDTYCSLADLVMPQFFFAAGFSFRLSLLRQAAVSGQAAATRRAIRRILGLALVALVVHAPRRRFADWSQIEQLGFWGLFAEPLKRSWFETLMHLAVTSLWVLPVIRGSAKSRLAWIVLSAGLHVGLSHWFNFAWVFTPPVCIDGGPLGFLTWSIPLLAGSLAFDYAQTYLSTSQPNAMATSRRSGGASPLRRCLFGWGVAAMLAGYLLSCGTRLYDNSLSPEEARWEAANAPGISEPAIAIDAVLPKSGRWAGRSWKSLIAEPPLAQLDNPPRQWNYWMMSQRAGTPSYLLFSTGFSAVIFGLFWLACDVWKLRIGFLETLGGNALIAYILHELVGDALGGFATADAPLWYVGLLTAVFLGTVYLFLRALEKQGLFLKL